MLGLLAILFLYFCYLTAVINSTVDLAFEEKAASQKGAFSTVFKRVFWAIVRRNLVLFYCLAPFMLAESYLQGPMTWEEPVAMVYWGLIVAVFYGAIPSLIVSVACGFGARQEAYKSKFYGVASLVGMFVYVFVL